MLGWGQSLRLEEDQEDRWGWLEEPHPAGWPDCSQGAPSCSADAIPISSPHRDVCMGVGLMHPGSYRLPTPCCPLLSPSWQG